MNRCDTSLSLAVCTFPMMKTEWIRRKRQRREDIMSVREIMPRRGGTTRGMTARLRGKDAMEE